MLCLDPSGKKSEQAVAGGVHTFDDGPIALANNLVNVRIERVELGAAANHRKSVI